MTKSRFDIEYNKWLQQVNVEEEAAVWNEIQDELDFIETWDNISVKLDEIMPQKGSMVPTRYLMILAAAAAIILIMLLPIRYFVEKASPPTIISELSEENDEKKELISDDTSHVTEPMEKVKVAQMIINEIPPVDKSNRNLSASLSGNELAPIIASKDLEDTVLSKEKPVLHGIKNLPFDTDIILTSRNAILTKLIETEVSIISEPIESSGLSFRVAEVGLVYGYKNTWLLNHETFNGLNPKKLGNTLPTFHQDMGVTSSIELNNRYLFGLEFLWKSGNGQNYQQYINASFVDRSINLDYLKLQAFYFWEIDRFQGQAIVGGYFARLTMAEEKQAKTRFSVEDSYSDLDYGLLAGYQFNIALKNKVIFKPGFRVSYDLVNIFEGNDITPSHFKKTRNLAASFNISFSYRFNK
ncbi:MAG: hypothetical protein R6W67_11300 [Bacteroidales bacterium]